LISLSAAASLLEREHPWSVMSHSSFGEYLFIRFHVHLRQSGG